MATFTGASSAVHIELPTGRLTVTPEHDSVWPVERLLDFAARINPRRGFLFVSKVLGRHIGARPADMNEAWEALVERLPADLPGPIAVVGMAETAIALGHGVYRALYRRRRDTEVVFGQSTRYRFQRRLFAEFSEDHSHASRHFVYAPLEPRVMAILRATRTLVLVDDELTTGRTLLNLQRALEPELPHLEQVVGVALTDWSGGSAEFRGPVASLLRGERRFEPRADFVCPPMPDVSSTDSLRDETLPRNDGRFWLQAPVELPAGLALPEVNPGERLAVVGTGEFVTLPMLVAEAYERQGISAWCHATTRSPAFLTHAMRCREETFDAYGDGIPMCIYNVSTESYDRVLVLYETPELPSGHAYLGQVQVHALAVGGVE
jgi:hypothetical protein